MLYANLNGEKILPRPKTHAKCPLCNETVISKCGEVKVWHWAHLKGGACDSWYEPETHWHKSWKLAFGKDNCEIKIGKQDSWHIADVLTQENLVIEFQNSPIQKGIIRKREQFYGKRMIWVLNGIKFRDRFHTRDPAENSNQWSLQTHNYNSDNKKKIFKWESPIRSWEDSKRHIFIDFHDKTLFWVHKGMGTKSGVGKYVEKEEFLNKYGGNYETYVNLVRSRTLILDPKKLRLRGIEENNIHLITSCRYNGIPRTLEIYFEHPDDILKLKELPRIVVNGVLKYDDKDGNLKLSRSKFVE